MKNYVIISSNSTVEQVVLVDETIFPDEDWVIKNIIKSSNKVLVLNEDENVGCGYLYDSSTNKLIFPIKEKKEMPSKFLTEVSVLGD